MTSRRLGRRQSAITAYIVLRPEPHIRHKQAPRFPARPIYGSGNRMHSNTQTAGMHSDMKQLSAKNQSKLLWYRIKKGFGMFRPYSALLHSPVTRKSGNGMRPTACRAYLATYIIYSDFHFPRSSIQFIRPFPKHYNLPECRSPKIAHAASNKNRYPARKQIHERPNTPATNNFCNRYYE